MNDTQIQSRIIKADKRIRTFVVLAYIVAVLVMLVLLMWVLPWGEEKLKQAELGIKLRIIRIVIAFVFLSVMPFGLYMCRFGWRVIRCKQMPPPGTKVIMDTKVLEGDKAVMRGRIIIAISLVLIIVGLYGGLYFPYKLKKVFGNKINQQNTQATESGNLEICYRRGYCLR